MAIKDFNSFPQEPWPLKAKGKKRKRLCRYMVDIWNKTIQHKLYVEGKPSLTAKREERLIWFLEEVLGHGTSWESYCHWISQLSFLGKITLDWALLPQNASRVFAAVAGREEGQPRVAQDIPWGDFYEGLKNRCQQISYGPQWFQISQNLAKRLGQKVYQVWFSEAFLTEFTDKTVALQVGSTFKRDYIKTYFFLDVVYAVQKAYPTINQLTIQAGSLRN